MACVYRHDHYTAPSSYHTHLIFPFVVGPTRGCLLQRRVRPRLVLVEVARQRTDLRVRRSRVGGGHPQLFSRGARPLFKAVLDYRRPKGRVRRGGAASNPRSRLKWRDDEDRVWGYFEGVGKEEKGWVSTS